jgi:hypothetical protein
MEQESYLIPAMHQGLKFRNFRGATGLKPKPVATGIATGF